MRAISNRFTDTIFVEIKRDLTEKPIKDELHAGDIVNGRIQ